jgi:hypothetical protein
MQHSMMEVDYFTSIIRDYFPRLYEFTLNCDFFEVKNVFEVTGGIKWLDSKEAIKNICSNLKKDNKIAFCPAGGIALEVLDTCNLSEANILGFFDTYKASHTDAYEGYPLYHIAELTSKDFDSLILLSSAYADELYDNIKNTSQNIAAKIYCPFLSHTINTDQSYKVIDEINQLCSYNKDKPTIVFAVERFSITFINRVKYLKKKGVKTILMTLENDVSHSFSLAHIEDYFDLIYYANKDRLSYLYVLQHINGAIIHLMPVALHYDFSVLLAALSKVPVICEFNDILSSWYSPKMEYFFEKEKVKNQFHFENYLCTNSKGIIYKNGNPAFNNLKRKYNADVRGLQFQAYIDPDYIVEKQNKTNDRLKLVYSGGVYAFPGPSGDATLSLYDKIIDVLTEQGIYFDIYNIYDCGDGTYSHYYEKAKSNKLFTYHRPVNHKNIITTLSEYDYGWHMFELGNSIIGKENYSTAMTTKFFDYLSAGLPVIVSSELEYLAEIVNNWNIGIVLSFDEIYNLHEIITYFDLQKFRKNISRFYAEWSLEKHIDKLIHFYEGVLQN